MKLTRLIVAVFLLTLSFLQVFCKNVIIIGSGSAGLAAASKLIKNNISVTILEAESRFGGRVNSVHFGNAFVDLGAQWCAGSKGNLVYKLVKNLNLLEPSNFTQKIYYHNSKLEDSFINDFLEVTEHFGANQTQRNVSRDEFRPISKPILSYYNKNFVEKYKNDAIKLKIAQEASFLLEHFIIGRESAGNWSDVWEDSHYNISEGDQNLNWKGQGYKTVLNVLLKQSPGVEEKILFNKKVVKIIWNNTLHVETICSDGSSFKSDVVIFTPSVGVLKADHQSLFYPNLNALKVQAINHIGLGAVVKVAVLFPETWWDPAVNLFTFLWSFEDRKLLLEKFKPAKNGNSWVTNLNNVMQAERNPKVLIFWFTGELIEEIEGLSDQQLLEGMMFTLNHFMGKDFNISNPIKLIRSSWLTNPNFRGTWTYETVRGAATQLPLNDILQKPLLDSQGNLRVLFGGEATNHEHYGTVNGAMESGFREAKRFLNVV